MKLQRLLALFLCVAMALLACPAFAIEFNAEEAFDSVFVVTSGNALGSGFAIGENCIVTNAHVLQDVQNVTLYSYSGDNYSAFLVGKDDDSDIAILGIKDATFPYLTIGDYKTMNTGDDVYAIGAPRSMAYTLTKGVISAKEREMGDCTYIQTDAAINGGNSGGPLLNDEGKVIGMNTLKMTDTEGIGLSIPMETVGQFLKTLNIACDDNGNVLTTVSPLSAEDGAEDTPKQTPMNTKEGKVSILFIALLAGLFLSVALNILLVILLVYQKKKNLTLKYNPRERIDFEIDILE